MEFPGNIEDYREFDQECQQFNSDPRHLYVSKFTMCLLDGFYYFLRGFIRRY